MLFPNLEILFFLGVFQTEGISSFVHLAKNYKLKLNTASNTTKNDRQEK